jgi:PTH1 family peptidyl-tRNA hydrolase
VVPEVSPWLVVGLADEGARQVWSRHNVGAMVLDGLARALGQEFSRERTRCDLVERDGLILAKPRTRLDLNGEPVAELVGRLGVPPHRVLVVHDELDLPFATFRLKRGGGDGGHHGLRSISESLGTRDYGRLRFGIGRPPAGTDPADHVRQDFTPFEQGTMWSLVDIAEDVVLAAVREGWAGAQNRVNGRRPPVA